MRYSMLLCSLLVSSRSLAEPNLTSARPEPFEMDWLAPNGCPDAAFVRRSLQRLLATGEPTSRHLRADARIEQSTNAEFTLKLRTDLDGTRGERILRGQTCASVSEAAVLTMALMLNPDTNVDHDARTQKTAERSEIASSRAPAQAPTQTETASSLVPAQAPTPTVATILPASTGETTTQFEARATSPTAIKPPVPTARVNLLPVRKFALAVPKQRPWPHDLLLSTQLGLAGGVLPKIGPELGLGIQANLGQATLCLNADFGLPQRHYLAEGSPIGGRLWTATLTLFGCWTARGKTLAAGPCIGNAVTRLEGRGLGVLHPQKGIVYWYAPLVAAHLDARLDSGLSFRLLATGLVPVDRPRVYLEDLGELHRPSAIEGRVQIGAIVELH